MNRDRALGWLTLVGGFALAVAIQAHAPVAVPLYDGVVVNEPYRYLTPTPGHAGSPTSFESKPRVDGSISPLIAAATLENPPQAQLIALQDAFELTPGATSLRVTITPIAPEAPPTEGSIAGNVYRFAVTDQAGTPLQPKRCESCRSLVLRAPEGVGDASINRFDAGAWVLAEPPQPGVVGIHRTNADALGDFALITGSTGPAGMFDPIIIAVVALAVLLVAIAGLFWYRRRPPSMPVAQLRPTGRLPSKRRGSGRTPRGRSNQ